jgi:hypothetical protein
VSGGDGGGEAGGERGGGGSGGRGGHGAGIRVVSAVVRRAAGRATSVSAGRDACEGRRGTGVWRGGRRRVAGGLGSRVAF